MRILVTGGAGYIGSHAARRLARAGHDALLYDNLSRGHRQFAAGFELIVGDLANRELLMRALRGCDAVMHFAALTYVGESAEKPRLYFDNNIIGALSLLNATMDAGVRKFVFSSTAAVYGIPAKVPITEDAPRVPINNYGVTKLFLENALAAYSVYGLRAVFLRYFNAAGADNSGEIGELHDPETHLIPLVLKAAAAGNYEVEIFGRDYPTPDGTCVRDYIHVNDLADAHVAALEYLKNGGETSAINLGTGQGYSVKEIVRTVEEVTGLNVRRRYGQRRAGDPPLLVADGARANRLLGFRPSYSLHDIVRTAWEFFNNHRVVKSCITPS